MKHLILATAAVLSLATAETALAQRPQAKLVELAASGLPQQNTNVPSAQLAAAGGEHPAAETNQHGTQLAQGWHPQAHDNQASTNA